MDQSPREKAIEALKEMSDEDFQNQKDKLEDRTEDKISNHLESLTWEEKTKEEIQNERDWSAINQSMENEGRQFRKLLADLVTYIDPEETGGKGRNGKDIRDMLFSICLKEYLGKSYRTVKDELRQAESQGYISETCCFSTYTNYKKKEEIQEALEKLITLSGTPLNSVENVYAVDATGFSDSRFGRWHDNKYNGKSDEHIVISKRDFGKVQEIDQLETNSNKMHLIRGGLEIQDLSDKTPKKHLHKRSVHAILLSEKKPHKVSVLTTEEKEDKYSNNEHLDDYDSVEVICGEEALDLLNEYREEVKTRRDLEASGIR